MPLEAVVGSRIAAEVSFRVGGVLTDPTVVVAKALSPNGVLTSVTYPDTSLVQEAPGVYRFEFQANVAGLWPVRFEGSGAVEAVGEQVVIVQPSNFS